MGRPAISPDGSRYAYTEITGESSSRTHLVDVASGADRVVLATGRYAVLEVEADRIYLTAIPGQEGSDGLWALDLATGGLREIRSHGAFVAVVAGGAWLLDRSYGPASTLSRLDVGSGQVEMWVQAPAGTSIALTAFNLRGQPLIVEAGVSPPSSEVTLLLVSQPNSAREIYGGGAGFDSLFLTRASYFADSHGVWLMGPRGISLVDDTGLRLAFDQGAVPAGSCA